MLDVAHRDLGPFSKDAAISLCGARATRLPVRTFAAVFDAVLAGKARYGVVPARSVRGLLDEHPVIVLAETDIRSADAATPNVTRFILIGCAAMD